MIGARAVGVQTPIGAVGCLWYDACFARCRGSYGDPLKLSDTKPYWKTGVTCMNEQMID